MEVLKRISSYLETPIEYLKGVGPQKADLLKSELRVFTYGDLLHLYPFRYVDRTKFYRINEINPDLPYVQLRGRIVKFETVGAKRAKRLIAYLKDETGIVELVWFQGQKWIAEKLNNQTEYVVFGKPSVFNQKINLAHPEIDPVSTENTTLAAALQPVYSTTEKLKAKGLDSKGISKLQKAIFLNLKGNIKENLTDDLIQKNQLISKELAVQNIHFPANAELLAKAQQRLKFEELFFIQLRLLKAKVIRTTASKGFVFEKVADVFNEFYNNHLPFQLTGAQKRVLKEIRNDVGSGKQMNRLLQGDVGSGKTLVALMTMLMAIDNGFQSCLMAPTEILANQHFITISDLLKNMNLKVSLLTGSTKTKARRELHESLQKSEINILIGTHALIEDEVQFANLGMVVIDEQHRFGVEQRARLWRKNTSPPHVLVMTATPIPRTLAMTLYGDLDVSVIDELPPGRKEVKTVHRFDSHRAAVFGFMKEQIAEGRQVYVVYPLIKESEKMDYKDLMDGYESIVRSFPPSEYQVSIVHGQMKSADKDYEMERFIKKQTQIMVATTVIEVGVNVPNASVMVIESAERFGLSQLHQLRGRVGRGAEQSYCILMTSYKLSNESKKRMEIMVRTTDGFEIADEDLKMRGPGDIEGTQQSGLLDLKIADLAKDAVILQKAREEANAVLQDDPELVQEKNQRLVKYLVELKRDRPNWSKIS